MADGFVPPDQATIIELHEAGEVPARCVNDQVTLDGVAGRARDLRTVTSPIFGSRSFPPGQHAGLTTGRGDSCTGASHSQLI
jgi:hypothetical protein